jgi:hypothetical protein
MKKAMKRVALVPVMTIAALAALGGQALAAGAGPEVLNCGFEKTRAGKAKCAKQNKANRIAFNQIKNSKFVGVRGDGEELEETFCANGRYESRVTGYYGTGVSTGLRWAITNAVVRQGGKWIDAILQDESEGFEVGIQRRGSTWKIGVARFGSDIEEAGVMVKTKVPPAECATLGT